MTVDLIRTAALGGAAVTLVTLSPWAVCTAWRFLRDRG